MPRPRFCTRALAVVLVMSLAPAGVPQPIHAGAPGASTIPGDVRSVTHALNRLGFGPRPGDVATVTRMGLAAYIEQQLHPSRIDDALVEARLARLSTLRLSARTIATDYYEPAQRERRERQRTAGATPDAVAAAPAEGAEPEMTTPGAARSRRDAMSGAERGVLEVQQQLVEQRLVRAIDSERQLQEVLVDFWFNHFNVFAGKGAVRIYVGEYERDVIRPRVLGSFRDLIGAVAKSPAMLFYLDNWMSTDPKAPELRDALRRERALQTGAGRRPGMARGAAARRAAGNAPRRPAPAGGETPPQRAARGLNENYARELLELHTLGVDGGFTQADIVAVARAFTGWTIAGPRQGGPFAFVNALHDRTPKTVLGHVIDEGGIADGERVLDILSTHPSTARFIATKLARRFVADDPPAALVERAAQVFLTTRGDLRAVTRTIITSPEFFAQAAWRAKTKSPLEFVVSAIRAVGGHADNAITVARTLRELGQPLYQAQPPTGYKDTADAWVNTGALLARMNAALALAGGRMRGITTMAVPGATPDTVRRAMLDDVLAGDAARATRDALARSHDPAQIVALTLGSPDFQRR